MCKYLLLDFWFVLPKIDRRVQSKPEETSLVGQTVRHLAHSWFWEFTCCQAKLVGGKASVLPGRRVHVCRNGSQHWRRYRHAHLHHEQQSYSGLRVQTWKNERYELGVHHSTVLLRKQLRLTFEQRWDALCQSWVPGARETHLLQYHQQQLWCCYAEERTVNASAVS